MRTLRLVLGDQLNYNHSWFTSVNDDVIYCMFEMRQETDYVKHHIQKVVAFFLAMRQFHGYQKSQGHRFEYFEILNPENKQDLQQNINQLIQEHDIHKIEYQLPDEFRLDEQLKQICNDSGNRI